MTFAKQLKRAREKAGFTMEQVAVASGYGYHSIYAYETGRQVPPMRAREPLLESIRKAAENKTFADLP